MNAGGDLLTLARVAGSLVVVLVLAVLAARLARRAGAGGAGRNGLRVLERTGLSRESSVAVIEVGGRSLVLGVSPGGVRLLTELAPLAPNDPDDDSAEPSLPGDTTAAGRRRVAAPPTQRGSGSVLDPRTWQQGVESLRDLTSRKR